MELTLQQSKHKILTRWWLRKKIAGFRKTEAGEVAVYVFYVPKWAKPLDFIHRLIFGSSKINKKG